MVKASCCAERFVFAEVFYGYVRKGFGGIFDEVAEDVLIVVAHDEYLFNVLDFGNRLEAVLYDGVSGDFEERLYTNCFSS